jgi:phosphatidylserine/phosphatidylglycerophosphate/cardiolipin synthase-like enzyme
MYIDKKIFLILLIIAVSPVYAQEFQTTHVSTFVSPDSGYEALSTFLDTVESFLYLSVYEMDNPLVGEEIRELLREGKNITIIVDDSPAGGFPDDEKGILTMLKTEGAVIYLAGDQFRFYHGKYGISDNNTLFVTTENLGRNGFPKSGTKGNRGWGAIVEDDGLAFYFAELFFIDLGHSQPFAAQGETITLTVSAKPYTPVFELRKYEGISTVIPAVAPDDAVEKVVSLLGSANSSIYIEQFYVYKYWGRRKTGSVEETPNLFLESAIAAARRGVKVRILLDDTWYNIEKEDPVSNYNTVLYVNDVARREGLDLEARLINSEKLGIEKLHAKGVVVDEKAALVSTINWNENSPKNNREVGVIIVGEPARYYAEVFEHDWGLTGTERGTPLVPAILVFVLVVVFYFRKRVYEKGS